MYKRIVAVALVMALPSSAWAGSLKDSIEEAGRVLAEAQAPSPVARSRGRLWSGLLLVVGGAALTAFGAVEVREDDSGAPDTDDVPGEADSSTVEKAMLGGGIAAVAAGTVLLLTGRRQAAPSITLGRGLVVARHTVRF